MGFPFGLDTSTIPAFFQGGTPRYDFNRSLRDCYLNARLGSWLQSASAKLSKTGHSKQALNPKVGLWRCIQLGFFSTSLIQNFTEGDVWADRRFLSTATTHCNPGLFGRTALHFIDPPVDIGMWISPFSE